MNSIFSRKVIVCFLLAALTLGIYWPVLQHKFVNCDDPDYVTENSMVQQGVTWLGIKWAFTTSHASNWHPLTWISHMVDVQFYGQKSGGHHATSLFLHLVNTVLLFLLLQRITGALWRSALVSALFAWHPLHVESVAWVSERKDVLSTLFFLLTLWAYTRFAEGRGAKSIRDGASSPSGTISRPLLHYFLALFFFALGLMSKPMLVTLPFILLLLDYWPLGRMTSPALPIARGAKSSAPSLATLDVRLLFRLFIEKLPFFLLVVVSCAATFIAQRRGGAVVSLENAPVGGRMGNALISYVRYLGKSFWPSNLSVFYPAQNWPAWQVVGAFVLLGFLTAIVLRCLRTRPFLAVGWFWFVGTLVPVIGLVQVGMQSMADRYTYIPLVGIFIILAWSLFDLVYTWKWNRTAVAMLTVSILALYMAGTASQVRYWHDSRSLLQHALAATANNAIAHYNLGVALDEGGEIEQASGHYAEAIRIAPGYFPIYSNLGTALAKLGRTEEAKSYLARGLQINPGYAHAHFSLGNILAAEGKLTEAIDSYITAVHLQPDHVQAHNNLGNALLVQGRLEEAAVHYAAALKINPGLAEAHSNWGNLLTQQGNLTAALEHYAAALRINPGYVEAQLNRGEALGRLGRQAEAASEYRAALLSKPNSPELLSALAWMLATQTNAAIRDGNEALKLAARAVELDGGKDVRMLDTLAAAYAETGQFDKALSIAEQALQLSALAQTNLLAPIRARVALYQSRQAYRE